MDPTNSLKLRSHNIISNQNIRKTEIINSNEFNIRNKSYSIRSKHYRIVLYNPCHPKESGLN